MHSFLHFLTLITVNKHPTLSKKNKPKIISFHFGSRRQQLRPGFITTEMKLIAEFMARQIQNYFQWFLSEFGRTDWERHQIENQLRSFQDNAMQQHNQESDYCDVQSFPQL